MAIRGFSALTDNIRTSVCLDWTTDSSLESIKSGISYSFVMLIDVGALYLIALPYTAITGLVFKAGIAVVFYGAFIQLR